MTRRAQSQYDACTVETVSSQTGWHIDPDTLREVVDDRGQLEDDLSTATPADRVWLLRLLERVE